MSGKIYTIEEIRAIAAPIAAAYGAKSLHLFGSYARGDATAESDVDLIVDRGDSPRLRGWGMGGLYEDLRSGLDKEIDMLTPAMLSERFRSEVRGEEVPLYVN